MTVAARAAATDASEIQLPLPSGHSPDISQQRSASQACLIHPVFDPFFIANLYWPALLALCWFSTDDFRTGILFWQIYFITAPHRWITLVIVATDRNRTRGREWLFVTLSVVIVGSCCLLQLGTGSLLCLGAIDYVWNAWHFAAQHHGVFRLYQRKEVSGVPGPQILSWEKILLRSFLLYVIARVAGVGWHIGDPDWTWYLRTLDPLFAAVAVLILTRPTVRLLKNTANRPGVVYLVSVFSLFLAMLWAAHAERRQLVLQLALVSAVFHSVEYMAVVTWASTTEKQRNRADLVGRMARHWILFLAYFVLFLGLTNYLVASGYQHLWISVNLMVAFLHYAYDGIIWKARRRPRQAGPV